jgi:hypothetical protein
VACRGGYAGCRAGRTEIAACTWAPTEFDVAAGAAGISLDQRQRAKEALDEPFTAFPSWFLRIECDRCGKVQMVNEVHMKRGAMRIRDIIARMRHDGCGGRAGKVELLTGVEGVSMLSSTDAYREVSRSPAGQR